VSLTTCLDCQNPVSDQAPACPHCGRPMQASTAEVKFKSTELSQSATSPKTQTIEATGKKWKTMQLIGGISVVLGVFSCAAYMGMGESVEAGVYLPGVFWMIGICTYLFGRVGGWWFHH
jgi:hypothetical protein